MRGASGRLPRGAVSAGVEGGRGPLTKLQFDRAGSSLSDLRWMTVILRQEPSTVVNEPSPGSWVVVAA
jgi:hypothetical protein